MSLQVQDRPKEILGFLFQSNPVFGNMQIHACGSQASVPQDDLDGSQVCARFQKMRGKGVPEGMRRDPFGKVGLLLRCRTDFPYGAFVLLIL